MTVDGKIVDVVTSVIFLGALTTRDGLKHAQKNYKGKAAMRGLTLIWEGRDYR